MVVNKGIAMEIFKSIRLKIKKMMDGVNARHEAREKERNKYGPDYRSATCLEMAAFKCCDKKMFRHARQRRRDALLAQGITPWF